MHVDSTPHGRAGDPVSSVTPAKGTDPAIQQPTTPLTPLQLRQWQRAAQRSLRLAVTAFKAGRTQVQEATDTGTAAATALTNSLLTAQYLPSMQLPTALGEVHGLKAAAASKLQRRQQEHLRQLVQAVDQVAAAVKAMERALAEVQSQLGEQQQQQQQRPELQAVVFPQTSEPVGGTAVEGAVQGSISGANATPPAVGPSPNTAAGPAGPSGGSAAQCSRMPVFHILALPEAAGMLQQLLQMHQNDLLAKQQVLDSFAATMQAQHGGPYDSDKNMSSSGSGGSQGSVTSHAQDKARRQLTVLITCWMTKPYVDDSEADQLLQVLTDEMTGF